MNEPDSASRPTKRATRARLQIWALGLIAGVALGLALVAWNQRSGEPVAPTVSVPALGTLPTTEPPEDLVDPIAPDFEVATADGGGFHLAEHLASDGRPVLLNLWASWCFPCREEMPALDAGQVAHPDVHFIGVAVQDTRANALEFVEEIGVSYQIGFDDDSVVETVYPPLGMPETYLISSDGLIVRRLFGEMTTERIDAELRAAFGS